MCILCFISICLYYSILVYLTWKCSRTSQNGFGPSHCIPQPNKKRIFGTFYEGDLVATDVGTHSFQDVCGDVRDGCYDFIQDARLLGWGWGWDANNVHVPTDSQYASTHSPCLGVGMGGGFGWGRVK